MGAIVIEQDMGEVDEFIRDIERSRYEADAYIAQIDAELRTNHALSADVSKALKNRPAHMPGSVRTTDLG